MTYSKPSKTNRLGAVKSAFVIVTAIAISVTACRATTEPAPEPGPSITATTSICDQAIDIPAYSVTFEDGSMVEEPSGADRVIEASSNGDSLGTACAAFLGQWVQDAQFEGYRVK